MSSLILPYVGKVLRGWFNFEDIDIDAKYHNWDLFRTFEPAAHPVDKKFLDVTSWAVLK